MAVCVSSFLSLSLSLKCYEKCKKNVFYIKNGIENFPPNIFFLNISQSYMTEGNQNTFIV